MVRRDFSRWTAFVGPLPVFWPQKDTTMNNQQLEIRLPTAACRRPGNYRQRRVSRARWWFSQMRRVVDEAAEWTSSPVGPQEQTRLPLAQGR
jgi:hypothetical protein